LEFWDEAGEHDAYIRNCTSIRLDSNGINRSPTEAVISTLPDLEICKIWVSKCYSYIIIKIIPNGQHNQILGDTVQLGLFLGYSNDTTKHIKGYSPDVGYIRRSSREIINKTQKRGDLNLRLRTVLLDYKEPNR
jgi:hypothetical protein